MLILQLFKCKGKEIPIILSKLPFSEGLNTNWFDNDICIPLKYLKMATKVWQTDSRMEKQTDGKSEIVI